MSCDVGEATEGLEDEAPVIIPMSQTLHLRHMASRP